MGFTTKNHNKIKLTGKFLHLKINSAEIFYEALAEIVLSVHEKFKRPSF